MIAEITQKMISYYKGNKADIAHFLKVWSYAKTICELEHLDAKVRKTVEITAIVHDISVPLCREKYGSCGGSLQEKESEPLVLEFLEEFDIPADMLSRIVYIVCHHHTYKDVDGIDYQIMLEADYLVNADEHGDSTEAIRNMDKYVFATDAGHALLRSIYLENPSPDETV